jgi:hypothetical protein
MRFPATFYSSRSRRVRRVRADAPNLGMRQRGLEVPYDYERRLKVRSYRVCFPRR